MSKMYYISYDLNNEKVQYLIKTDKKLGKLIKYIKKSAIVIETDGFICLVKYIIGQQISDKARETIWQRIRSACGKVTPNKILTIDTEKFRVLGLSERKIVYIKALATSIINNEINLESFSELSNEEIITQLTKIKGIGKWTAEMYLIFSLGRENVLSNGDGTIKRTIKWIYDLDHLPSEADLDKYFYRWKKYATIVSLFLWKSIELGLTQKEFSEIP